MYLHLFVLVYIYTKTRTHTHICMLYIYIDTHIRKSIYQTNIELKNSPTLSVELMYIPYSQAQRHPFSDAEAATAIYLVEPFGRQCSHG